MVKYLVAGVLFLLEIFSVKAQSNIEGICGSKDYFKEDNYIPAIKDTIISRGTMDLSKAWAAGSTLKIKFLNGNNIQKERVKKYAVEWTKYANIIFQFVIDGSADIRISFDSTKPNDSYIGTDAMKVDKNIASMNLNITADTDNKFCKKHIQHEFGHALGLLHEQSSPLNKINWDFDTLYKYYSEQMKWTKKEVDQNVLHTYGLTYSNGDYDHLSIMHYFIPPFLTKDHKSLGGNYELSNGDRKLIANIYPKDTAEQNQTPNVPFQILTSIDTFQNNLIIKPFFRLQDGIGYTFKIVAYFFDEEDKPLPDVNKTEKRSQDGQLVAIAKVQPDSKVIDFNGASKNKMQLNIPIENLPVKKGNNQFKYKIIVWSGNNSIYKSKMFYLPLKV